MPLSRLLLAVVAALVAVSLQPPAPAHAGPEQFSIMLDDDQLLYRGDEARDFALQRMKSLGVDVARVSVLWSVAAENARKGRAQRRRFKASDPSTYPVGNWDRYDRLVRAAQRIGIGVYLDVTGPGPSWAHARPPRNERDNRATWKPNAREFGKFVRAVGMRYSGSYRDENDTREPLPRVSFWAIYNEPNQQGWLTPQYERKRKRGKPIPWSPVMYRSLWYHGRKALDLTGHRNDWVLIGETAPLGSSLDNTESPLRPKKFIRELFCIRSNGRRYTGRAARDRRCGLLKKIRSFRTFAWAHHPYTKKLPPDRRDRSRDSISIANISDLGKLLDQMARKTRRIPRGTSTIMTEFGYETNPPDPFSGVSYAKQAAWINDGDYIAFRDPRVVGQTQFLLRDVEPFKDRPRGSKQYWFTYQSGLYDLAGGAKPAATSYAFPLVVTPAGGQDRIWGQVRFRPNAETSTISLQFRPEGQAAYTQVGESVTILGGLSRYGFFETTRPSTGPGTWRAVWRDPNTGAEITSRDVPVQ